jgi:hypothetical protein
LRSAALQSGVVAPRRHGERNNESYAASVTAAAFACVFAGSLTFAKTPEPAPAGTATPTPAAPASSEPSDTSKVEKWTKKEWNNAVKEWAQDEKKCIPPLRAAFSI